MFLRRGTAGHTAVLHGCVQHRGGSVDKTARVLTGVTWGGHSGEMGRGERKANRKRKNTALKDYVLNPIYEK